MNQDESKDVPIIAEALKAIVIATGENSSKASADEVVSTFTQQNMETMKELVIRQKEFEFFKYYWQDPMNTWKNLQVLELHFNVFDDQNFTTLEENSFPDFTTLTNLTCSGDWYNKGGLFKKLTQNNITLQLEDVSSYKGDGIFPLTTNRDPITSLELIGEMGIYQKEAIDLDNEFEEEDWRYFPITPLLPRQKSTEGQENEFNNFFDDTFASQLTTLLLRSFQPFHVMDWNKFTNLQHLTITDYYPNMSTSYLLTTNSSDDSEVTSALNLSQLLSLESLTLNIPSPYLSAYPNEREFKNVNYPKKLQTLTIIIQKTNVVFDIKTIPSTITRLHLEYPNKIAFENKIKQQIVHLDITSTELTVGKGIFSKLQTLTFTPLIKNMDTLPITKMDATVDWDKILPILLLYPTLKMMLKPVYMTTNMIQILEKFMKHQENIKDRLTVHEQHAATKSDFKARKEFIEQNTITVKGPLSSFLQ